MLQTLRIKNLAIVENVQVSFEEGLNVITGETGAGKSIIAGALGLVLGERADKTMIRSGETKCQVDASFQLADPKPVNTILDELELEPCNDGNLVVRRVVSAPGSGKVFVNDCPTTLQVLKKLGDVLVDLHGPHDHQSLLSTAFQLELLDAFGQLSSPLSRYKKIYSELTALEAQRKELDGDDQSVSREIEMLSFQINEIEEASLREDEEEELNREHARLANAGQILELADSACSALSDGDTNAFDHLVQAQKALSQLAAILDDAEPWKNDADSASIQVQELASSIRQYAEDLDADPERLQWLDDRVTTVNKLKRKYGGTIEAIISFLEKSKARLEDLESRGERLKELEKEIHDANSRLVKSAKELSSQRKSAAVKLSGAITDQLRELGFAHGVFKVDIKDGEPGPSGTDDVEFGFAPNPGETMRPLRSIASSGEISRVMLATKAVLALHDKIPVLVFDEIDTNVGGEMGNAIGRKLASVAEHHQVLCITHLPQVAVHGKTHFVVVKSVKEGRTRTQIEPVSDDARVNEVARMLTGDRKTSVTFEHARELLGE